MGPPSLSERLQAVTEALAAARNQQEVFGVVLTPALQALDAVAGAVLLVDQTGTRLETAARQGYEEEAQTLWQDGPLDGNVPAGDALERHEALFFEEEGNLVRAYPELEARTGGVAAVATAVLPMFLDDQALGVIILDFKEPHKFTDEETRFLRTLASQCALAVGRTRLLTSLQRQVEERTRRIEEEARAQEAFVAFTEAVGTETDLLALARQAIAVLRDRFQDGSIAYHSRDGDLWRPQVWSEDMGEALVARLRAGLPDSTPFIRRAVETGTAVFTDGWDPEREGIEPTEEYGSAAAYPLAVGGEVRHLLAVGLKDTQCWSERDRALMRAVGRGLNLALERAEQTRQLQARTDEEQRRTQTLQAFAELSRDLVLVIDPLVLIRRTQEVVLGLLPAGYSMYFEPEAGWWHLRSQVGQAPSPSVQALLDTSHPFEAATNLLTPYRSGEAHFQDEYDPQTDQLSGDDDYPGATVVLPVVVEGQTRGVLGFALYTVRSWSREDRAVLETVGHQLTLALERAEQARQREEERAALDAFAAYTEASAGMTDVHALARRAVDVLQATLGEVSVAYYDLDGALWKARVWSNDFAPEVVAVLTAGVPTTAPSFAEVASTREVVFVPGWEAGREGVAATEGYGAAALYPCLVGHTPQGLLAMGTQQAQDWTPQERQVFRAVGRSLTLALERAEGARRLETQNAELDARTRALEGFADLTRDLSVQHEPEVLKERALTLALSLLPPGYAVFWRLEGDRWRAAPLVGDAGTPELQAVIDAGLPAGQIPTLDLPFQTREPLYQDVYDQSRDIAPELVRHVHTTATLPVLVNEEVVGIFIVVLFEQRSWSPADRAVLETTVRSLGLALERAEAARDLMTAQLRLRAVVDNAPVVLFALDRAGTFTLSEGQGLSGLGLAPGQAVGRSAYDLYQGVPELLDDLRLALTGQEVHQTRRIAGRVFESWTIPVKDAQGVVTDLVGVSVDVTERQQAEEDLARRNEELRRSNASTLR